MANHLVSGCLSMEKVLFEPVYVKPVQTGFPADSDEAFIKSLSALGHVNNSSQRLLKSATLFTYSKPASPHLCALEENRVVSDEELVETTKDCISSFLTSGENDKMVFVELAGGVNSPVMSSSLVCDAFRPLRLPVILVGDSKLGGISSTISALDSLLLRGYDVPLILLFDNPQYANQTVIANHINKGTTRIVLVPKPPTRDTSSKDNDFANLAKYYQQNRDLGFELVKYLGSWHQKRMERLQELHEQGSRQIWWPFTQHKTVKEHMVIDSAFQDNYLLAESSTLENSAPSPFSSKSVFDAAASWWTNGLGHGNLALASSAAYAAGRYGHVISPEVIHEPKYRLTSLLLETAGKGWADRVFFSDNGSTAIEVALKMAFSYSRRKRREMCKDTKDIQLGKSNFEVVSLKGSYHGDTIGAMDISDPNVYNDQVDWYTPGRGLYLDVPTLKMRNGKYQLDIPAEMVIDEKKSSETFHFDSLDQVFALEKRTFPDYKPYIIKMLENRVSSCSILGGLVMEPILMGAGGMLFVDPLFQKELIQIVRQPELWDSFGKHTPLPVVFDEVFVGMYRLGVDLPSVSSLLQETPDISCFAKCLTGGLLPLAATLATSDVFKVFEGDSKIQSLLHGHSYTAHPVGCSVAVTSLIEYEKIRVEAGMKVSKTRQNGSRNWSVWPHDALVELSRHSLVEGVNALGTVLIIELKSREKGIVSSCVCILRPSNTMYFFFFCRISIKCGPRVCAKTS